MRVHLQRDIDRLKRSIVALGAEVEGDVRSAYKAFVIRNSELAREVIRRESRVDAMEVNVEEECLKILALHQPVAGDLRYIIAVLKMNSDLERIGDLAAHIAERGLDLCGYPGIEIPAQLDQMATKSLAMLSKVLDAFTTLNTRAAREVCGSDDEVNGLNQSMFLYVKEAIEDDPSQFAAVIQLLHLSRHMERIADHTTNIAEDLLYLTEGRIIRHTAEAAGVPPPSEVIGPEPGHGVER